MQWGKANEEFGYIMLAIFAACAVGFLASIFPIISTVLMYVVISFVTALVLCGIAQIASNLYRDHQALHGPISPDEVKEKDERSVC